MLSPEHRGSYPLAFVFITPLRAEHVAIHYAGSILRSHLNIQFEPPRRKERKEKAREKSKLNHRGTEDTEKFQRKGVKLDVASITL